MTPPDAALFATARAPRRLSVVARLGALIAAIGALAVVSILASMTVAELASGQARAINLAGSLRMQSYVIAATLADGEHGALLERALSGFDERYAAQALTTALPASAEASIRLAYDDVGLFWAQTFRPYAEAAPEPDRDARNRLTADLVARIDHLVALIEHNLESRLQTLRLVQGISLFLLLVLGGVVVHQINRQVRAPLGELLTCARVVRRGDFSVRAAPRPPDELGQLGEAFNYMVEDLSRSYSQLETRVEEKTRELARSNQSLELLYRTTRALSEADLTQDSLLKVLNEVERLAGVRAGALCADPGDGRPLVVLATDMDTDLVARLPLDGPPSAAPAALQVLPALSYAGDGALITVPVSDGVRSLGRLFLQLPDSAPPAEWQTPLLETVGRHVGAALANARRHEERHRLALLDERAVIARELHDSLAQSLSYLKIQVTRLQNLLARQSVSDPVGDVVRELRDGLNEAYRQLRELLTTFRLRIDGRGLTAAIDDSVREFSQRGGLAIHLSNRIAGLELPAGREIHVLQIIREALSNIERHARAHTVDIVLERLDAGDLRVCIDDDGVGIGEQPAPPRRFGIAIMHDRARSLDGALTVTARTDRGTRVELCFPAEPPAPPSPRGISP